MIAVRRDNLKTTILEITEKFLIALSCRIGESDEGTIYYDLSGRVLGSEVPTMYDLVEVIDG